MLRLPSPARAFCYVLLLPAMMCAAEKPAEIEKSDAEKARGLPKYSPFEQRGTAAAPVATNETIEFAGVSSIGQKTDLIFYDKTAKKSHWIAKGETKEGIAVVSYDERREEAVIKVNGVQKTLPLRKTAGPVSTPRPVVNTAAGFNVATPLPAPVPVQVPVPATATATTTSPTQTATQLSTPPPAPGSPAEVQAKQETEARMLVSDLLEIGMAQRRAYEEAQRKAAEGTPQNATSSPTTNVGTPMPVSPAPSAAAQPAR